MALVESILEDFESSGKRSEISLATQSEEVEWEEKVIKGLFMDIYRDFYVPTAGVKGFHIH